MTTVEEHPFEPFLPENGNVLFLGSFPPPRIRWSMEFYYPNWQNDFWRIIGLIYFQDIHYFEIRNEKRFDKPKVLSFCENKGFAFYDSASKVCRLKDNASDNSLQIVEPSDIVPLLERMPRCGVIVTTGGKSSEELASILSSEKVPSIGSGITVRIIGRSVKWFRAPSSSRAYPMSVQRKAATYREVFEACGLI